MLKLLFSIIAVLFISLPSYGIDCDINGDGYYYSPSDLTVLINYINGNYGEINFCEIECDLDQDDEYFTIGDIGLYIMFMIDPITYPDNAEQFSQQPDSDTLKIGYIEASPGNTVMIPVDLVTVDTISAYEFTVLIESEYVEITNFIFTEGFRGGMCYFENGTHVTFIDNTHQSFPAIFLPGEHRLGYLQLGIDENIPGPTEIPITFSGCPDAPFHTGLANLSFFQPVLVDGGIRTLTGIEDVENLPLKSSISAYPNPFNSCVNLVVDSEISDRLAIYDILGCKVRSFDLDTGLNSITWDGRDDNGNPVSAGLFLVKAERNANISIKKLLLIK